MPASKSWARTGSEKEKRDIRAKLILANSTIKINALVDFSQ